MHLYRCNNKKEKIMKKSRLFLSIISLCFSLAVLCFGVYAANQINYQISGNISYLVSDVYMNVQTKLYYSATYMEQEDIYDKIEDIINEEISSPYGLSIQEASGLGYNYETDELDQNNTYTEDLDLSFTNKKAIFVVMQVTNYGDNTISLGVNTPTTLPDNIYSVNSGIWTSVTKNQTKLLVIALSLEDPTVSVSQDDYSVTLLAQNGANNLFTYSNGTISKTQTLQSYSGDIYIPSFYNGNRCTTCGDFSACINVTGIHVPTTIETMTYSCLSDCKSITSLSLPFVGKRNYSSESEAELEDEEEFEEMLFRKGTIAFLFADDNDDEDLFYACMMSNDDIDYYLPPQLATIKILFGCKIIFAWAFKNDNEPELSPMSNIIIPRSVQDFGNNAFRMVLWFNNECSLKGTLVINGFLLGADMNLENISSALLVGVRVIAMQALRDCNLTTITLPVSVQEIRVGAFSDCKNLSTINYEGTSAQWNSITLGENWNYDVPATSVHCLGDDTYVNL